LKQLFLESDPLDTLDSTTVALYLGVKDALNNVEQALECSRVGLPITSVEDEDEIDVDMEDPDAPYLGDDGNLEAMEHQVGKCYNQMTQLFQNLSHNYFT
jgi:signal transduction histidine kinase